MKEYIIKRILLAIFTLFVIITVTFFLMNLIPGGPFSTERAMSVEVKEALMKRYNLDKPLFMQYLLYLKNILHGDFGVSIKTNRNVLDTILSLFPISLKIGVLAIILALIVGVVLGVFCALYKNTIIDKFVLVFSTFIVSVPGFVIASFLLTLICVKLKLLPVWSQSEPHLILPVISMALSPIAVIIKYMRSSMLDTLGENYIKTARAKGLSEIKVLFVHALKNAIMPIITYIGPLTAGMITGSVVIEQVFTVGGLGAEFINCIEKKDYPLIMGISIFFAFIVVFINLISDILYKMIDPRIKF